MRSIWDNYFWFPDYVTWDTFQDPTQGPFRDHNDVYLFCALGLVCLLVRLLFQCLVAIPVAHLMGVRGRRDTILSDIGQMLTSGFDSKSKMKKFLEVSWRFFFYAGIFLYGLWALWDKPWLWDIDLIWVGYPYHVMHPEIRWYYALEASFYWSLMFSQFTDVKRKDFYMNMIHHMATITLLTLSWYLNMVRAGTLILVVHDAADAWLESAKMAIYSNKSDRICNGLFGVFLVVWVLTRCGFYPLKIVKSAVLDGPNLIPHDHYPLMMAIMTCMLIVLQFLHFCWTYMIFRVAITTVRSGHTDDVRSDSEEDPTDVKDKNKVKNKINKYD